MVHLHLDDLYDLARLPRFIVQVMAATIVVVFVPSGTPLWLAPVLVVGLVWGLVTLVIFAVQAFAARVFPYAPEVPEEE